MMSTSTGDFYVKKFLSYHWRSISSRRAPIFNNLSSMGKLLADALGYYHFDNDSLVEEACGGESAAKSLKEQDEEEFHDSETEVLKQLSSMGQLVVCAGNGSVHSSINLALLGHGISIWIDVPIEMVAKNVIEEGIQIPVTESFTAESYSGTGDNQVLAQLVMLYEERKGGYATADASVSLQKVASQLSYDDLDAVTTEDMTMEVLKEIQRLARLKKMKRDLCFLQALRPLWHPLLAWHAWPPLIQVSFPIFPSLTF